MAANTVDHTARRRRLPGARWLSVFLRGAHLVCVIWLGAVVHGAPLDAPAVGWLVFASGMLLFALDLYSSPQHVKEIAGLSVLAKLSLVLAMIASESARQPLFWSIVVWSAVFSHAPGSVRHRRVF